MSLYNPTMVEWVIYLCIFSIGVITGRVLMAVQVGFMKPKSDKNPVHSRENDKLLSSID